MSTPFFLTVDTEGDNIWDRPKNIQSSNVEKLYRFQVLCTKYNIKPIYLTNHEAASNKIYQDFIETHSADLEIGMHIHAWNTPPIKPLTSDDYKYQPYLHEFDTKTIIKKMDYMTKYLQDTFQDEIISHRGGRYSINEVILESLDKNGYKVDCSVVPGYNFAVSKGDPREVGGPDYRNYSHDIHTIHKGLIEIPMSTYPVHSSVSRLASNSLTRRIIGKLTGHKLSKLRSQVNNLNDMKKVVYWNLSRGATHLEYMIHSSELTMGTSNLIRSKKEEDLFYKNLEQFFQFISSRDEIVPQTFKEYVDTL